MAKLENSEKEGPSWQEQYFRQQESQTQVLNQLSQQILQLNINIEAMAANKQHLASSTTNPQVNEPRPSSLQAHDRPQATGLTLPVSQSMQSSSQPLAPEREAQCQNDPQRVH